ncbi:MAG: adenine phosphoribosyltransferase [Deltaproteobacteria bacterium]|nr:adenine phosphoribosyltransferase [Deltaproteobacteria bacterium]
MDLVRALVRDVPDFPKKGILFRDITPVLGDAAAFRQVIDALAGRYADRGVTKIAGIESRGFVFASAVAYVLGCGFVILRKPGKLPRPTYKATYALEYGQDTLHVHQDALAAADQVVVLDDLIATGGTAKAAAELVGMAGATLVELAFVIELTALGGRERLRGLPVFSLLSY